MRAGTDGRRVTYLRTKEQAALPHKHSKNITYCEESPVVFCTSPSSFLVRNIFEILARGDGGAESFVPSEISVSRREMAIPEKYRREVEIHNDNIEDVARRRLKIFHTSRTS